MKFENLLNIFMSQIKSPLISIIIVNYNNAKFLKKV